MKEKSFTIEQFKKAYRKATFSESLESFKESMDIGVGIAILGLSAILLKKTEKLLLDEEGK